MSSVYITNLECLAFEQIHLISIAITKLSMLANGEVRATDHIEMTVKFPSTITLLP